MKLEDERKETPFAARDTILDIWMHLTELCFRGFGKKPRKMPNEPKNFSTWKEELRKIRARIENKAGDLRIIINPRKTKICPLSRAFTYLQYKYYLTAGGHVVIRINPKTVTRMRRKLKRFRRRIDNGTARTEKAEEMFRSWIANYRRYMSKKQCAGIISLYEELFNGGLNEWMKERNIV